MARFNVNFMRWLKNILTDINDISLSLKCITHGLSSSLVLNNSFHGGRVFN